ncbi:MAG TPA: hypothetical protein VLK84_03815 [Longimicrobium sp.]|nr:hypothetical protein [Longimicrobium sp.]
MAKAHAQALAELLGSRAVAQRRGVIGEPLCLYAIPLHDEAFWFTVRVSDRACVIDARHRRQAAIPVTLAVALGEPSYGSTEPAPELSSAIGMEAFAPPEPGWMEAARTLLDPALRAVLAEIDGSVVRRVALYNTQLDALIDLQSVEQCAEQVGVLRRLLLAVFNAAPAAPPVE